MLQINIDLKNQTKVIKCKEYLKYFCHLFDIQIRK